MTTSTKDRFATACATLGPVGHLPKGPGTWGSAAAVIAAPFLFLPFQLPTRCVILVALFIFGSWASGRAEQVIGRKDPGCVVIDEVLGQWLTYLPFSIMATWQFMAGFVLFRIFDIAKPFPIRRAERWLPAGWGVMLDDAIAGLYAAATLYALRLAYLAFVTSHSATSM